jgi:hypothetical protein
MRRKYWYVEHLRTIYSHYMLDRSCPATLNSTTNQLLLGSLQYVPFKGKVYPDGVGGLKVVCRAACYRLEDLQIRKLG